MNAEHDAQNRLIAAARDARTRAIAPYSNFRVGAVLETAGGRIFTGCNIENASYGLTMCAERVAIFKALSEGEWRFQKLAIVAETNNPTPPCGACRQIIWEFCGDITVVLANESGDTNVWQMRKLYPHAFDKTFLE